MGLSLSLLYVIVPMGLVIAGITLVQKRGEPETAGQRTFLFLAWTAIGVLALLLVNWIFPNPAYGFVVTLAALVPGLVAMTLLHAREWRGLPGRHKSLMLCAFLLLTASAIAKFWISNGIASSRPLEAFLAGMLFLCVPVFLFVTWKWGERAPVLLGILALLYLAIFNGLDLGALSLPPDPSSSWLAGTAMVAFVYLLIPGFAVTTTALLVLHALRPVPKPDEPGRDSWKARLTLWVLIALLLAATVYTFVWLWVWDGVEDGVRYILLLMATSITVLSTGLVIALTSSAWRRWVGLPFAGLVLAVVYAAGPVIGTRVSNYAITEARARRIQQALESYQAETSQYPADLRELAPGELWRIPLPMVIPGQGWCYEGGPDFYRLGLVYREHWSSPYLSVRLYASAGDLPQESWTCDQQLAELRAVQWGPSPVQTPLPESPVSVPRTVVTPVLSGSAFSVGDWSPDGRYLVIGQTEYSEEGEGATVDLYFLAAGNGNLCQPPESRWTVEKSDGLSEHYAWLPDGRFLYLPGDGAIWAHQPCSGGAEDLSQRFPNRFTHVASFHEPGGQALLKDQDGLWLLNGNSLELRKIAGVPAETSWAWYTWTRDGKRLAVSQLMGPEQEDGAFLFIIDTGSGEIVAELALPEASDANLPLVEWLTGDQLLLHGKSLPVMDIRSDPPETTDLLREVFLLDIEYPDDVASMDTYSHPDGTGYSLGLRLNHPHNQGVYLYASGSGQVQLYQHDTHSLFFFPDGGWLRLPALEEAPSDTDEYEMVWMERPLDGRRLVVEGHLPRSQSQIFPKYLPGSSQLLFSSAQGISLVSLPDGKTIRFWELAGASYYNSLYPSPNGEALVVAADGGGLYYIPLPSSH